MSVQTLRKAELFYKALEDVWAAEQTWKGSPNIAVWLCTQAAEKTMKGYLRCHNKEYGYDHNLRKLLDAVSELFDLSEDIIDHIVYLDAFEGKLRYRNMTTDPTAEDAKLTISRTKTIIDAFEKIPDISGYIKEAKEIRAKILKSIAD